MKTIKPIPVAAVLALLIIAGAWMWTKSARDLPIEGAADSPYVSQTSTQSMSDPATARALAVQAEGSKYMANRDYPRAVEEFKKSLQIQQNPNTKFEMGMALTRAGRRDEAIQTFKEIAEGGNKISAAAKKVLTKMERDPQWGLPKK